MKVLILANNDNGLYLFRRDLIMQLLHDGHEIVISVPEENRRTDFETMGCTFIDTPIDRRGINIKADLLLLRKYRKIVKETTPELIITYTIKPNIYGGLASRFAKKQYAANITGLGTAFENPGIIRTIVVNLYKFALRKAKVIFFENRGDRDSLVSFGCCKKEKTVVLNGAGVNTKLYTYQPYPDNEVFKFLFIGRVMKEKGVEELLEAMRRLNENKVNCFLDVVGPYEEDYSDAVKKYEKAGWLKYHGVQADVKPFIAACDCFVLPSYHEGMANTNLECASSGRPIITSNIPGCKEAVVEGSGFLCEPRNTDSLYKTMKEMLSISREERERMGQIGRKHMEDVFDKKKVVEETIKNMF